MINSLILLSALDSLSYIVFTMLIVLINTLQIAMFIRAILSWVNVGRNSKALFYLFFVTEIFIKPVRKMLSKIKSLQKLPIDISFLVTYILLSIISSVLTSFIR